MPVWWQSVIVDLLSGGTLVVRHISWGMGRGVTRGVALCVARAQPLQDQGVELVGELAADLDDLSSAAVVPQGARHLLVGHGFAVALALAPALR